MKKDKFVSDWFALSAIDKMEFITACENACKAVESAQVAIFTAFRQVNAAKEKLDTLDSTLLQALRASKEKKGGE